MNVISIDPGVERTGIYLFRNGQGSSISIERPHSAERWNHLAELRKAILQYTKGMDLALVEDYPYGLPALRAASAIEVGGVVRGTLTEMGVPIIVVGISTWKALTIGHMRKGTISEVKAYCRAVHKKYGHWFATADEADAFLIYVAVLRIQNRETGGKAADRIRQEIGIARRKM